MPFIELAAAALLAQAAAAPTATPAEVQPPIHVEAGEASWDVPAGEALLHGGVLLRRGTLTLRAPEARYRPATGRVEAPGGALLVEGPRAVVARALRGEVGGVYEADQPSVFFVQDAQALAAARSPEEAARLGRRLTLRADRARGSADGGVSLAGARATTCDCPEGVAPSWEIRAKEADVRPGERAVLSWPVLWITPRFLFVERPVPVLAFPWLYVPLGERQTGLLVPEFGNAGTSGPTVSQPLFVTLGRSADATVWGGWAWGRPRADVRQGKPAIRGPLAALELRWAPAEHAEGKVRLDYLHDLDDEPGGTHGARVAVTGEHAQRIGERTELRLALDLVGDPLYVRDFTSDLLRRDATYRRSAFLLSRRGEEGVWEGSGAWLEPTARDGSLAAPGGPRYGPFGAGLPEFQRGPALSARLMPQPLAGGLLASGRVELARFGPLSGVTSDGGSDGIGPGDRGWAVGADPGQLDGRWEPGERLAASRAALRAELSRPFTVGRWLRAAPFVRGAASGYAFDAARAPIANAWAIAGASVESELARHYGALRHSIVPRLAWRIGSGVAGEPLPAFAYDAWDRIGEAPAGAAPGFVGYRLLAAAPAGTFNQGRASLETWLDGPAGELLRVEVGQDLDLATGRAAETFATLRASVGAVTADAVARYAGFGARPRLPGAGSIDPDDWTEVRGTLRFRTQRGVDLHAAVRAVGAGGSPAEQAGADALFDPRTTPLPASAQANAGFRLPIGPATLGYDVLFPPRDVTVKSCDGTGTRSLGAFHVQQQTATVVWNSPFHCFRLSARVGLNDCGDVSYDASIDLWPKEPAGAPK